MISGYTFHKFCKFSLCDRYPMMTKFEEIKDSDFVFLNFGLFEYFVDIISKITKKLPKFNLVCHNSDRTFSVIHYNLIKPYIHKIYCINCDVQDNFDIIKIPIGFPDDKYTHHMILKKVRDLPMIKNILCYLNFTIGTNIVERKKCYYTLKDKQWITREFKIQPKCFYEKIKQSKYVISPSGAGYDCYRVYESLLLDSIPIIKRNPLSDFYNNLPVFQINNWEDLLQEDLELRWELLYNKLIYWKISNPEWTKAEFWCQERILGSVF